MIEKTKEIYIEEEGKGQDDKHVQKTPEQLYQELISRVRKYHPSDDISLIEKE